MFIRGNTIESVVCEMAAILSWPQCVNATLMCSVMGGNAISINLHNRQCRNVSFFILRLKFPTTSRVSILICDSMKILCALNNSLLVSRKFCDRSLDQHLSAEINGKKCVSRCRTLSFWFPFIILPASAKLKGGILVSPCPSVRLSVCGQNRVRSVSSTMLVGSISYLHILSSNFRRCVACNACLY